MRYKYSISYHYPVIKIDTVQYTTSVKFRLKTWIVAKLVNQVLRLWCALKSKYYWTSMSYISKYGIDTDVGISYQDEGPWRSYQLTASGDSLEELLADASISEIDQDGGDLDHYPLEDATNEIQDEATKLLEELVKKAI